MTQPISPEATLDLPDGELLAIAGADALAFAQAQFTNDVQALTTGDWQWNCWLDAKGRVQALFALHREADDRLLAWLPAGGAEVLATALSRFRFRSKVQLQADPSRRLVAVRGEAPRSGGALPLPADARLGTRHLRLADGAAVSADATAVDAWHAADLRMGLPWLRPGGPAAGRFVPQWLGLEALPAVSLRKGCYPGQEIVARLHYLGQSKRAAHLLAGSGAPPPPGSRVLADDGTALGEVADAVADGEGWLALAALNAAAAARVGRVAGPGDAGRPARDLGAV